MEFPIVESRTTGGSPNISDSTTHPINLPASPGVGNLLLVVMGSDGNRTFSTSSPGWVTLGYSSDGRADNVAAFAGVAGSSNSLTVTTSGAENTAHIVYEVSNWSGSLDDIASAFASANGSRGTNAFPPLLVPAGGETDYLWIAAATARVMGYAPTGPAEGFGEFVLSLSGSPNALTGGFVGSSELALRTDSLEPGPMPLGGFDDWSALTIAIPPPSGSSGGPGRWFQFF